MNIDEMRTWLGKLKAVNAQTGEARSLFPRRMEDGRVVDAISATDEDLETIMGQMSELFKNPNTRFGSEQDRKDLVDKVSN